MPAKAHRSRALIGSLLVGLVSTFVGAAAPAQADLTTVSVDTLRTGWDSNQPKLTPSDVTAQDFGQLFATQLDGQVYAQPVVARNTLLAVTENDKAYGLDPVSGAVRWTRDIGTPWSVAPLGCGDGSECFASGVPAREGGVSGCMSAHLRCLATCGARGHAYDLRVTCGASGHAYDLLA